MRGFSSVEFSTGIADETGDLFDLISGQLPVACVDSIPYTREVCLIVSAPGLWCEYDVFELLPSRQLLHLQSDLDIP